MSSRYAAGTSVAPDQSRNEIERTLARYGADRFMYGWDATGAVVGFEYGSRMIRFVLPLPDKNADEFWFTPSRRKRRSEQEAFKQWEQACRQSWRALALVIKAKLEAVEAGIVTFEDEFMAHMVLPDGSRVGDRVQVWVDEAYELGGIPAFPMLGDGEVRR